MRWGSLQMRSRNVSYFGFVSGTHSGPLRDLIPARNLAEILPRIGSKLVQDLIKFWSRNRPNSGPESDQIPTRNRIEFGPECDRILAPNQTKIGRQIRADPGLNSDPNQQAAPGGWPRAAEQCTAMTRPRDCLITQHNATSLSWGTLLVVPFTAFRPCVTAISNDMYIIGLN